MFKKLIVVIICLLVGCAPSSRNREFNEWKQDNGKLKVLSTIGLINDLVKEVGGQYVDTFTLIDGQLDPHTYHPVKGDDEKFSFAGVIFYNGLGLEHNPGFIALFNKHPNAIALGEVLHQQNPRRILYYGGQPDPHIWQDASLWADTLPIISATLSKEDPEHAKYYNQRARNLHNQLMGLHREIRQKFDQLPPQKRYLISTHDAFNYFARAYLATPQEQRNNSWQPRCAAPEGLSPESQLSTHDLQLILDHIKKYHIKTLFAESNVNSDSIKKVVQAGKEQGLSLQIIDPPLYSDSLGPSDSDANTYKKMMMHNANALHKWLSQD